MPGPCPRERANSLSGLESRGSGAALAGRSLESRRPTPGKEAPGYDPRMRPARLLMIFAFLSSTACAGHRPAEAEAGPAHPAFKSFGLKGPVGPAFDAAEGALTREKLVLE